MQAGLTLGIELYNLKTELVLINIDKAETYGLSLEEIVFNIITEGSKLLGVKRKFELADVTLNKEYDKAGYGVVTSNEKLAIQKLARKEGILLDPAYIARAFYGMLHFLKEKKIRINSNVLFWHTRGLPAIFSCQSFEIKNTFTRNGIQNTLACSNLLLQVSCCKLNINIKQYG